MANGLHRFRVWRFSRHHPLGEVNENTFPPGSSISVQLVRGDYSLAAAGTVTLRDGDRIYAFGHPFLSLGASDMPMAESSVVTVISNMNNSFKLVGAGTHGGFYLAGSSFGNFGLLGQAPKMIPVKVNLHTSRDRTETYSYEMATDSFLTPLLLNITLFSTITSSERALGDSTISVKGEIKVKGQEPIQIDRRFSAANNTAIMAAGSIAAPVSSLLTSGFDDVQLDGITLDIASTETSTRARSSGSRSTAPKFDVAKRLKCRRTSGLNRASSLCREFRFRFRGCGLGAVAGVCR